MTCVCCGHSIVVEAPIFELKLKHYFSGEQVEQVVGQVDLFGPCPKDRSGNFVISTHAVQKLG